MNEYRITKYNPKFRNEKGHYIKNGWISYYDIGNSFDGTKFTLDDYIIIEKKYIDTVVALSKCNNVNSFKISELQKNDLNDDQNNTSEMTKLYKEVRDKTNIDISMVPTLMKLILREIIWCKLESQDMFVHFGYDYYMYVGTNKKCDSALEMIQESGLYVEKFESPHA